MKSFYVVGFYGAPNIGDELLCRVVTERLQEREPETRIRILSRDADTSRRYTNPPASAVSGFYPTPEYFFNIYNHVRAVRECDVVVFGGGGLLEDYYTWMSVPRFCIEALYAMALNRGVVFAGLGVREIRSSWLRELARFTTGHSRSLYCRDRTSAARLESLTGRADIVIGPDLGNMLDIDAAKYADDESRYALLNLRLKPKLETHQLNDVCRELSKHYERIVLLIAEEAELNEFEVTLGQLDEDWCDKVRLVVPDTLDEAIRLIVCADSVIATRLHVNAIAVHAGKRLLTVAYEDKVLQFMRAVAPHGLMCDLDELTGEMVRHLIQTEPPGRPVSADKLAEATRRVFDESVDSALEHERYDISTRGVALAWLALLNSLGLGYASLVLVKRLLFGRGPLSLAKGAGSLGRVLESMLPRAGSQ